VNVVVTVGVIVVAVVVIANACDLVNIKKWVPADPF